MAVVCLPRFDVKSPSAIAWAEAEAASLVREISEGTREDLQQTIAQALSKGRAPEAVARDLVDMIGLLEKDRAAVLRRWESLVEKGYAEAMADRMSERYAARLLKRRALTIARSETSRAANIGVRQGWQQAIWNGYLESDALRVWIGTDDERIREEHAWLAGLLPGGPPAQVVRIDEPFRKEDGTPIEPGEEPNCRCSQGIARPEDIEAWREAD